MSSFTQKQLFEYPPIIEEIAAKFPQCLEKGVIFSWGDSIYNPSAGTIPKQILAHEAVHGQRQLVDGIEKWWKLYIEEETFRFQEELPAHQEEYKVYCTMTNDREQRARYLHRIACRLAGELYGRCCSYMDARKQIKEVTR